VRAVADLDTDLDRSYLDPETRAAAARYLTRTDNADLLVVLGLVGEDEPQTVDGRPACPACRKPYPEDGRRACRRTTCRLGPRARGVKR
jgi:hypothetical protein